MGEARREALRVDFDSQIKLEFHGTAITSDAGLVAYRELDEALGLTATADDMFRDHRRGKNTQHEVMDLLRQAPQNSPRRDNPGGCPAPTVKTRGRSPTGTQDGDRFSPQNQKHLENGVGANRGGVV
jgi:hypothetical protein